MGRACPACGEQAINYSIIIIIIIICPMGPTGSSFGFWKPRAEESEAPQRQRVVSRGRVGRMADTAPMGLICLNGIF